MVVTKKHNNNVKIVNVIIANSLSHNNMVLHMLHTALHSTSELKDQPSAQEFTNTLGGSLQLPAQVSSGDIVLLVVGTVSSQLLQQLL